MRNALRYKHAMMTSHLTTPRRLAVLAGAAGTSIVGVLMAAAAAFERGATAADRALIVAVSCCIVLAAHILPAITRTLAGRTLWVACLLLTAWGHAAFFTAAASRAGEARAAQVPATSRASAVQTELDALQGSRLVAAVSADLAGARARDASAHAALQRCMESGDMGCSRTRAAAAAAQARADALADELVQARRAADLRAQMTGAAAEHDDARAAAAVDPVAAALSAATGVTPAALSTGVAILSAVVVELLAALLWSTGLARPAQDVARLTTTAAAPAQPAAVAITPKTPATTPSQPARVVADPAAVPRMLRTIRAPTGDLLRRVRGARDSPGHPATIPLSPLQARRQTGAESPA